MVQFLLSVLSYVGLLFLSVIGIPFWMSTFRTLDRKYWGGSVHVEHCKIPECHNYTRGVFSYLRPWLNNFHFGSSLERRDVGFAPLWNVATLDLNVATLVLHFSGTSRRWISTSRRWFCTSLERRDVGSQRRDVRSQLRDVGFNHSLERRDVGSQRHDVGCFPLWNVTTLPCLRPKTPSFLLFPCFLLA